MLQLFDAILDLAGFAGKRSQNIPLKHPIMSEIKVQTAPFDARFPYTNQTRNCWQNYVDFHKCSKKLGEEHETCQFFKQTYKSLCPNAWTENWDEQVESGSFAGRI